MLDKLMASFNSRVARSFEYVMTKVLKRLFASIHLDDQGIKMVNSPILMKRQSRDLTKILTASYYS